MAKVSDHSSLKIGIPKQMLQRLTRALAQVKADNTCIEITRKVYNKTMNSIKV